MSAEYEKIQTWLMVRQAEGKPVNPIFFAMDASHSARGGLLGYLLEGKKAWSEPPPKSYSRPCYAFFEAGMDGLTFTGEVWQDPLIVVINQHAWSILERKSDDCLIIKPEDCRSDRRWGRGRRRLTAKVAELGAVA